MNFVHFFEYQELSTERLRLKMLDASDVEGIFALRSNSSIVRYTGIKPYQTIDEAHAYISKIEGMNSRNECTVWSIFLGSTGEFIGTCCFWNLTDEGYTVEVGYDCLPDFQGNGYMREAVAAIITCGFKQLGFTKITAHLNSANQRSVHLLEKLGFKLDHYNLEDGSEMALYQLKSI